MGPPKESRTPTLQGHVLPSYLVQIPIPGHSGFLVHRGVLLIHPLQFIHVTFL